MTKTNFIRSSKTQINVDFLTHTFGEISEWVYEKSGNKKAIS
jgi:hypothetical protein